MADSENPQEDISVPPAFEGGIEVAIRSRELSYSPYSSFRVGCCIQTKCGKYISGSNVENASYGASICAERTAVVRAVMDGHTDDWACIAISGDSLQQCISPCGICRQVLREFTNPKTFPVVMLNGDGTKRRLMTLEELLPDSFGPDDLHHTA
ncbi:cytidine deaminase Ecym_4176 [Eremothecium cymbalariae DBVPG|uniref:Cytidine deaminase n=1 Tax=Eremothecium cymbalariae (strain CBS 270.75 / DBVPG 7215 / KCTC 17166 / NRRL Y-17582) TaxID=931890 RepID=G8JT99_ERECY|nr:hypothetical protein Ecym_4176 [Eremothecium cymbalariae DBVPG\